MTPGTLPAESGQLAATAMGRPSPRADAEVKVRGTASYAFEVDVENPLYLHLVQSSIAKGEITGIETGPAAAQRGVVTVLDHTNAPHLEPVDPELAILQGPEIGFRGQIVAIVVAETPEAAREAALLVEITYDEQAHRTELRADDPDLYKPEQVNPEYPTDSNSGRLDLALAKADVVIDATYETSYMHNNPMEPHATTARWSPDETDGPALVMHASTQSVHAMASTLAPLFGLSPDDLHVRSPYVGGGFGSKGMAHAPDAAAALAARAVPGRWVKLAVTRQQMFALTGYRTATLQHFQLAADSDGRLLGINHEVVEQTSAIKEFAEQTAVATRSMYAAPARHTSHRLAELDVAVPSWMRAPGEMPGMFAHEVAMDELAVACGLDPVELRLRNDHDTDPESGKPFGNRRLAECLREGAERFGWSQRDLTPGTRREGDWLIGLGVASATYPYYLMPGSKARVECVPGGRYTVSIGAADIGQGPWTVLAQVAADALGVDVADVDLAIGDTTLPPASVAGGSSGTASWGSAIVRAARAFRAEHGATPAPGATTTAAAEPNVNAQKYALFSYGAHFVELRVNVWTGEPRVARMLGVFSAGRIINPTTARSQLIGGMVMGLGSGLHEESVRDSRFGHIVTQDLASYHVPSHADIPQIEVHWLDEVDTYANPMGARGIGELGNVGTAAAVANAAWHATGIRVRSIPVTADKLLDLPDGLPGLDGHPRGRLTRRS